MFYLHYNYKKGHLVLVHHIKFIRSFFFIFFLNLLFTFPALSLETTQVPAKENIKEIEKNNTSEDILNGLALNSIRLHIQPRYQKLNENSHELKLAIDKFCSAPSTQGLHLARDKFKHTVMAFAAIEHIRFGPISEKYRMERLVYWPDHKGRGLRSIRRLLTAQDPKLFNPDTFSKKSVAVQGLTALEYVLYANGKKNSFDDLFPDSSVGQYRCSYGKIIAQNIENITTEVVMGWKPQSKLVQQLLDPEPTNEHYRTRKEVILEFYQSVTVEMKNIHDGKIYLLFGKKGKSPKPKRATFWRSDLTLNIVRTNLEAIDHFVDVSGFQDLLDKSPVDLQFHVTKMFKQVYSLFDIFKKQKLTIFNVMADNETQGQLKQIAKFINHLNVGFARYFALAADLPLGFNASDGD